MRGCDGEEEFSPFPLRLFLVGHGGANSSFFVERWYREKAPIRPDPGSPKATYATPLRHQEYLQKKTFV